jgi:GNAT superfamily N-acetyltransferase
VSCTDLVLRPAEPGEADRVADVYLAARRGAVPAMPPLVHPEPDVRRWLAGRVADDEVWVAAASGAVVGFARLTEDWLDDLYLDPAWTGRGIGGSLLELAKARRPDGFGLWVFESNTRARRFYARHGLVEVERTDGSGNEEKAPDVRMEWRGRERHGDG